jgi:FkbM family methyltransferase
MKSKYSDLSKYTGWLKKKLFGTIHTSYSQCGEDLSLDYIFNHKNSGFYVDIGANDPRIFSNTYYFYKKGWRGLVVEPNTDKLNLYNTRRPRDIRVNRAIGERGQFTLYKFKADGLNTISKEIAKSYENMGHKIINQTKVSCIPLSDLFEEYKTNNIDFISIDTEGQNLQVLKTNDWDKYRPNYVLVETAEYDKPEDTETEIPFNQYMESVGYGKLYSTPMNTIYGDIRN